jgi:hypothetical protein
MTLMPRDTVAVELASVEAHFKFAFDDPTSNQIHGLVQSRKNLSSIYENLGWNLMHRS